MVTYEVRESVLNALLHLLAFYLPLSLSIIVSFVIGFSGIFFHFLNNTHQCMIVSSLYRHLANLVVFLCDIADSPQITQSIYYTILVISAVTRLMLTKF